MSDLRQLIRKMQTDMLSRGIERFRDVRVFSYQDVEDLMNKTLDVLDERDKLRAALEEAVQWVRADIDVITKDWLEQGQHPESRQKIEEAEETARRFIAILSPEG